ncbi:PilZ domain-containing protein [bacterium]|nr:PilZ domain-containing protein [bacterium]
MAWYTLYSVAYAINETIDTSLFSKRASSGADSTYYILIGAFILIFVGIGIFYNWLNSKRIEKADQRYIKKKEAARHQGVDFSDDTSRRIDMLAKTVKMDPEKVLYNNRFFEGAVEKLRKKSPNDPMLLKIPELREDLGFTFFNRRTPFINTRMLQSGQKLRVAVNFKGKSHSYVSTILNTNEEEFWVKPPLVNGKAVNLSKFKSFDFSVFRKNDGEYQFTCRLKNQISTPANALVMIHVNKIKKLLTRENDRYKLHFKREFFFSDMNTTKSCQGVVMDISIGGLKFLVKEIPEGVIEGINVFFKLEEANIKQEIKAEIVKITSQKGKNYIHLRFQDMSELNRLYLQKFVAGKNPIKLK